MAYSNFVLSLLLLVSLPLTAEGVIRAACSVRPLCLLLSEIGQDAVEAVTIIQPGVDPHHFELKPSSARTLAEAEVIVLNGSGLEPWADALPPARVVRLAPNGAHGHEGDEDGWSREAWADPVVAARVAPLLAAKLCEAGSVPGTTAPECSTFRLRAESLRQWLEEFSARSRKDSSSWRRKSFVALHPVWGRMAQLLGLRQVGGLQECETKALTGSDLQAVVSVIRSDQITHLLVEPSAVGGSTPALVKDLGLTPVVLDSSGGDSSSYRAFLLGVVQTLAEVSR